MTTSDNDFAPDESELPGKNRAERIAVVRQQWERGLLEIECMRRTRRDIAVAINRVVPDMVWAEAKSDQGALQRLRNKRESLLEELRHLDELGGHTLRHVESLRVWLDKLEAITTESADTTIPRSVELFSEVESATSTPDAPPVRLVHDEAMYVRCLLLLPADFREEFWDELLEDFRQGWRDNQQCLLRWFLRELKSVLVTAISRRLRVKEEATAPAD